MKPEHFDREVRSGQSIGRAIELLASEGFHQKNRRGIASLNEGQLTVVTLYGCFAEVRINGIESYFAQQYGWTASTCVASFERVGLADFAQIMAEALSRCRNLGYEDDGFGVTEDSFSPLETYPVIAPFDDLETQFYELCWADEERWQRQLFEYIIRESDFFVGWK